MALERFDKENPLIHLITEKKSRRIIQVQTKHMRWLVFSIS
jgi:hypothetical protein